jgi:hypothetical protein
MPLSDSLEVLAATPPRKLIFNIGVANRRIKELETQLGLPSGKSFFNVGKANARIRELEAKLAQPAAAPETQLAKSARLVAETRQLLAQSAALKTPATPAAPKAELATSGATGADKIEAATLTALSQAVFGTDVASTFEAQRLRFTRAGLTVPGLAPAAANPNYTVQFVGFARTIRADRQQKIDNFFNPKH